MKFYVIKKAALSALLFLALPSAYGQVNPVHSTHTIDNNGQFWGLLGSDFSLGPENDSLLYCMYLKAVNWSEYTTVYMVMRKSDLSIKSEFFIDTVSNTTPHQSEFHPTKGNQFVIIRQNQGSSTYQRYSYNPSTGTLLKGQGKSHSRPLPSLLERTTSELIGADFTARSGYLTSDTLTLYVMDLLGNLKRSREVIIDSSVVYAYPPIKSTFRGYGYLTINPADSNEIIFTSGFQPIVSVFTRDSLKLKFAMDKPELDSNSFDQNVFFTNYYHFSKNKVRAVGEGNRCINCGTVNVDYVMQTYYVEKAWDGTILNETTFGDTLIPENGYCIDYDSVNNTTYLAGSAPFRDPSFRAREFREVIIYRFNQYARDSIRLFGTKNHVPRVLEYDGKSGDLFLLSAYSNAWGNGASFFTVTKIPNFMLDLIEEGEVEADVYIYPNPAEDFITVEAFDQDVQKVEVYSQSGNKIKTLSNPGEKVDVSFLKSGIYVILVTDSKGKKSSGLLRKN